MSKKLKLRLFEDCREIKMIDIYKKIKDDENKRLKVNGFKFEKSASTNWGRSFPFFSYSNINSIDLNKKVYSFMAQNGIGKTSLKKQLCEVFAQSSSISSLLKKEWKYFTSYQDIMIYDVSVSMKMKKCVLGEMNNNLNIDFFSKEWKEITNYFEGDGAYFAEQINALLKSAVLSDYNSIPNNAYYASNPYYLDLDSMNNLQKILFCFNLMRVLYSFNYKKILNRFEDIVSNGAKNGPGSFGYISNDDFNFSTLTSDVKENLKKAFVLIYDYHKVDSGFKAFLTSNCFELLLKKFQEYFPTLKEIIIYNEYYPFCYGSLYDCEIKIDDFHYKNLKSFNENASEGQIKILNMFFFLIDFHFNLYKLKNKKNIILLDDVLTSMDNSNVKSFFKMLKDLIVNNNDVFVVNLTHDFEIYRLFNNIFNLDRDGKQMLKLERVRDVLYVVDFPIKNNIYRDYLMMKPNKKFKNNVSLNFLYFVSCVSYYRNTVESYYSSEHPEYKLATDFLHLKNTDITIKSLLDKEFFKKTPFGKSLNPEDGETCIKNKNSKGNKKYWDLYKDVEIDISTKLQKQGQFNDLTYDSIEIKVFYSLFCRLYMEEQMFRYLLLIEPDKFKNGVGEITSNQTNALLELFAEWGMQEKDGKSYWGAFYPLRWKPEYEILRELLDCYLKVKNYISDYMHIQYNEVAYIINIKGDVLQNLVREMKEVTARADEAWNLAFSKPSTEDVKE